MWSASRRLGEETPRLPGGLHAGLLCSIKYKEVNVNKMWFRRWGWFHVPVSVPGVLVVVVAAAFCINVFLAVDRHSHSASDTLYGVFPFFVCTFLLVDWVGGRTSGA